MVCGNFILPEPASYVFFYAFSNLRNLLYIIFFIKYAIQFTHIWKHPGILPAADSASASYSPQKFIY